jgi:betaine-aldehyde dehydrogenase
MEHALFDILHEAGLPAGVVCMVCGGPAVGAALVADPGIDKISFTGSTAVGREVMKVAAERFKRVTLELGGKSALIVREDADVQQAVGLAVSGAFTNAGQMCSATSRILVHRSVHAPFLQAMAQAVQGLVAGPDDLPGCTIGPIISAPHRARVEALLQRGCDAGAAVLCHGLVAHGAGAGHFMAPVVVAPADEQNVLWQEEIFGPIACVRAFDSDDEALASAFSLPAPASIRVDESGKYPEILGYEFAERLSPRGDDRERAGPGASTAGPAGPHPVQGLRGIPQWLVRAVEQRRAG